MTEENAGHNKYCETKYTAVSNLKSYIFPLKTF